MRRLRQRLLHQLPPLHPGNRDGRVRRRRIRSGVVRVARICLAGASHRDRIYRTAALRRLRPREDLGPQHAPGAVEARVRTVPRWRRYARRARAHGLGIYRCRYRKARAHRPEFAKRFFPRALRPTSRASGFPRRSAAGRIRATPPRRVARHRSRATRTIPFTSPGRLRR